MSVTQACREKHDGEGIAKFLLVELLGLIKREFKTDIFDAFCDIAPVGGATRRIEKAARQMFTIGLILPKLTIAATLVRLVNLTPRNSLMTN
ncbi:hypothetical protein OQJ35_15270 [Legionella pneumophila]|uniref:hypothetical protein n=1 Tax=Legionella pneumophila TaxID=446 RepID=UPI001F15D9E5|nr:hypothetical protein [Legionella pneumophila]MCW8429878.1 hypothetical protein [Legionella pneumophila]